MPNVQQFQRQFRVNVGGIEFGSGPEQPLRFAFRVARDLTKHSNNADVRVWNLRPDVRRSLEHRQRVPVRIEAGYQGALTQVFFGALRRAEVYKEGPDIITRVHSGDGELQLQQARVAKTFPQGTPWLSVVRTIVQALGIGEGNLARAPITGSTLRPYAIAGFAADELEAVCLSRGLRWSVQDGNFTVAVSGQPAFSGSALISPATGLIGLPTIDSEGRVTCRSLMLPDMLPGRAFQLESAFGPSGRFAAIRTLHVGDSHSTSDWFTEMTGIKY